MENNELRDKVASDLFTKMVMRYMTDNAFSNYVMDNAKKAKADIGTFMACEAINHADGFVHILEERDKIVKGNKGKKIKG